MLDENKENRIRERAFLLWQEAGAPEGHEDEFWRQAEDAENSTDQSSEDLKKTGAPYPPTGDTENFA